jgi:hypothetical protein
MNATFFLVSGSEMCYALASDAELNVGKLGDWRVVLVVVVKGSGRPSEGW